MSRLSERYGADGGAGSSVAHAVASSEFSCPKYRKLPGSRRCQHFVEGGACARSDEFMCVEWLKANGQHEAAQRGVEAMHREGSESGGSESGGSESGPAVPREHASAVPPSLGSSTAQNGPQGAPSPPGAPEPPPGPQGAQGGAQGPPGAEGGRVRLGSPEPLTEETAALTRDAIARLAESGREFVIETPRGRVHLVASYSDPDPLGRPEDERTELTFADAGALAMFTGMFPEASLVEVVSPNQRRQS